MESHRGQLPTLLTEGMPNRGLNANRRLSSRNSPRNEKYLADIHMNATSSASDFLSYVQNAPNLNSQISVLPPELLYRIFSFLKDKTDPIDSNQKSTKQENQPLLLRCAQVCRLWSSICLPILHRRYYISKVTPFVGLSILQDMSRSSSTEWAKMCLLSLVCIHLPEWGLGAPRLFYIDVEKTRKSFPHWNLSCPAAIIDRCAQEFTNPSNPFWRQIISCSMDLQDIFWELATGEPRSPSLDEDQNSEVQEDTRLAANCFDDNDYDRVCSGTGNLFPGQRFLPMILRYSERMDLGCFLIFFPVSNGKFILLRAKPIGKQLHSSDVCGGKLLIWDDQVYGRCSKCSTRLTRVQVCADCRVAQYCSRNCQKADWDSRHKAICKSLAFEPYNTRDDGTIHPNPPRNND